MSQAPGWSPGKLAQWSRDARLRAVSHAFDSVPYYREIYDRAGIDVARLDTSEAWQLLPTTSKVDIILDASRFVSRQAERSAVWASTSGSTGMQMSILLDSTVNAAAFALFWRAWSTGGYWRLGQKHAVMKGPSFAGVFRHNWKLRALEVVSARINTASAGAICDALNQFNPRFMRGYPSSMYLFCQLLREAGLSLHLPMVVTGSEMLHEYQRVEFNSFLGARVINHWTHWERAGSILECERGRMHAQEDYGHHEILDSAGRRVAAGVEGELTVTSLHNRSMPLIRYRTGDQAVWSAQSCPCGRSFLVIERIVGRETDALFRTDGGVIPSIGVTALMKEWRGALYAQLVQTKPGSVEVRVVPAAVPDTSLAKRIQDDLLDLSDGGLSVSVRFCTMDDLVRSPVGKIRQCFNVIPPAERPSAPGYRKRNLSAA